MSEIKPTKENLSDPYVLQLIEAVSKLEDEVSRLAFHQKRAFFAGFSAGYSSCSAGLPGLAHNKERDYDVWRCRERPAAQESDDD